MYELCVVRNETAAKQSRLFVICNLWITLLIYHETVEPFQWQPMECIARTMKLPAIDSPKLLKIDCREVKNIRTQKRWYMGIHEWHHYYSISSFTIKIFFIMQIKLSLQYFKEPLLSDCNERRTFKYTAVNSLHIKMNVWFTSSYGAKWVGAWIY